MKFKKLFLAGYYTTHRNLVIVVKQDREGGQWLAEAKIREGWSKFVDCCSLDGLYCRSRTRKGAAQSLADAIDNRASYNSPFVYLLRDVERAHGVQRAAYAKLFDLPAEKV